ncbi:MAG: hypothetical protein DRO67_03800 [Candidatus Asgardarchaeum californiense]|nr:MAG: hypothetical protein DRO67_03800 [Candidatus Asgardarchaeum californiense]
MANDSIKREVIFLSLIYALDIIIFDTIRYFLIGERFIMPFMRDSFASSYIFLVAMSIFNGVISIKFETKTVWYSTFFGFLLFYFLNFFTVILHFYFDPAVLINLIPTLSSVYGTNYNPEKNFWTIYYFYMFWYFGSFILYLVMYFIPLLAITMFSYLFIRVLIRGIR